MGQGCLLIMNFIKLPKSGPAKATGLAPTPVLENDQAISVHSKINSEQKDYNRFLGVRRCGYTCLQLVKQSILSIYPFMIPVASTTGEI